MLNLISNRVLRHFSNKLKGPKSHRLAIKNNVNMDKPKLIEDHFKEYSQETLKMYKNNFTYQELQNSNEMVRRVFSLQNATPNQILAYRIEQAVKKYQKGPTDVGSAAVQCGVMSERIIFMMAHTKKYPKEIKGARFLTKFIERRRTMLNYLMRTDYHRYKWICVDYGIPEVHPKDAHHSTNFHCKSNPWTSY